jgi:diaminopimelate epimerase
MANAAPTSYKAPMVAFLKMHGLGNDFVVFDAREGALTLSPVQVRGIADRRFGIGCDTVVIIGPGGASADASLRFFNADGGEIESCGNATRCVARYLMDERGHRSIKLSTRGGLLSCNDAGKGLVEADMGAPRLDWQDIPLAEARDTLQFNLVLEGQTLAVSAASMGNPHCVIFVPDAEKAPVAQLGSRIEINSFFPARTNVEFVTLPSRDRMRLRVWERGVGITLACGTGACAAVVAAVRRDLAERKVEVTLDGGKLLVEWRKSDGHVIMTGPSAMPFRGQIDLKAFG